MTVCSGMLSVPWHSGVKLKSKCYESHVPIWRRTVSQITMVLFCVHNFIHLLLVDIKPQ